MHSFQPGDTLLHHEVVEKIGEGRMGEVFKAVDSKQLLQHPRPIVTWKVEWLCGRAYGDLGDHGRATAAFARATAIIREIAGCVDDERLQTAFLNSPAVQDVFNSANRSG